MLRFSVKPALKKIAARAKRWEHQLAQKKLVAYKRASVWLHRWVIKNFETEGGNVGNWAPFSPVTLDIIKRTDPGRMPAKLLQKTSNLRQSFVPFSSKHNAGVGSDVTYAKTHEEGIGRVPARRMLPRREEVIKPLRQILESTITLRGSSKDD